MKLLGTDETAVERALRMLSAIPGFPRDDEAIAAVGLALERAGLTDDTLLECAQQAVSTQRRWNGVPSILPTADEGAQASTEWVLPIDWVPEPMTPEERAELEEWWAKHKPKLVAKACERALQPVKKGGDLLSRTDLAAAMQELIEKRAKGGGAA